MRKATVTLPAAHREADFTLAAGLTRRLELAELHVFWTPEPAMAGPAAAAPPSPAAEPLPWLTAALGALGVRLERLAQRLVEGPGEPRADRPGRG